MTIQIEATHIEVDEQGTAPTTPAAGKVRIYAKNDGKLYIKDDAGAETEVGAGALTLEALTDVDSGGTNAEGAVLVRNAADSNFVRDYPYPSFLVDRTEYSGDTPYIIPTLTTESLTLTGFVTQSDSFPLKGNNGVSNNTRYVIPKAGHYEIVVYIHSDSATYLGQGDVTVRIRDYNTDVTIMEETESVGGVGEQSNANFFMCRGTVFAENDQVDVEVTNSTDQNISLYYNISFKRIGHNPDVAS